MQWEATDQFGNLYVGESEATTLEQLQPELVSLVDELCARTPGPVRISIDLEYGELNGPNPEQISHVLRVPSLASLPFAEISAMIATICAEKGIDRVTVE